MKKHKDLVSILRHQKMRVTPARRLLLQFFIDHSSRQITLQDIHHFFEKTLHGTDRSSIYRNIETFKQLEIIQELRLPGVGKRFRYIFDRRIHHYFICKACGQACRGNQGLFRKIEQSLSRIKGFDKANLSVVFYGQCPKCR